VKKKVVTGIAVFAVAVVVAAGTMTLGSGKPPEAEPTLAPLVSVVKAETRETIERVTVTGSLFPRDEILVGPELDGLRITEVLVDEGDKVVKGQVLARLSRDILDSQISQVVATIARNEAAIHQANNMIVQAEAANVEAQQALQRTESLKKSGNATDVQMEQRLSAARGAEGKLAAARNGLAIAEAEKRAAEAQHAELQVRLDRTDIKAPEEGIVSRRNARIGTMVLASAEPLFRIIARGEIELEAEVTEYQLPRLHQGALADVVIDNEHILEGKVRVVFPEVDRTTRLGRIRISLPANPILRIGAFTYARVELARHTGVAVPLSAVIYGADGASVQVVSQNRVETRQVKTGLTGDSFVQIMEGVEDGAMVVARAGSFLQHGDNVRVVMNESPVEATEAKDAR